MFTALFLGEIVGHRLDFSAQFQIVDRQRRQVGMALQTQAKNPQQLRAARIQGAHHKISLLCNQFQCRIHKAHIPSTVAPRIFVAAGKNSAAAGVDVCQDVFQRTVLGQRLDPASNFHPSRGPVDPNARIVLVAARHFSFSVKNKTANASDASADLLE